MTDHTDAPLLTTAQLGPYTLRNRLVMAPMTRNRAGPGNVPQPINVAYYRQRAGAGLIVTEGTQVSPQGVGYPGTPGIHSRDQVRGWREVTQAVHGEGGRIFAQLWHVGRISHPSLQPDGAAPVAPSALRPAGETMTLAGMQPFETPRALAADELPGIVDQHRRAAINALEAGFDGVEIHAANGYLLDQFLRDGTNRRTDDYGGSIDNRARLALEVAAAVADIWGADRVGIRVSPANPFNDIADATPDETFGHLARALGRLGLAYLHVVEGDGVNHPGFDRAALRAAFAGPYIANGGYDFARGNAAIAAGEADLVSFGKPYLANPDLAHRLAVAAPLNTPDPATFYGGDTRGYIDYPTLEPSLAVAGG
jgi:N-ethylmaleimide reductase